MFEDILDQIELAKTGLQKSLGHLSRIEQQLNRARKYDLLKHIEKEKDEEDS